MIEEQHRAAIGRNHIEDKAQKLPLQRFPVTNPTDAGRNLQQKIQIVGKTSSCGQRRPSLFGVQINRILLT